MAFFSNCKALLYTIECSNGLIACQYVSSYIKTTLWNSSSYWPAPSLLWDCMLRSKPLIIENKPYCLPVKGRCGSQAIATEQCNLTWRSFDFPLGNVLLFLLGAIMFLSRAVISKVSQQSLSNLYSKCSYIAAKTTRNPLIFLQIQNAICLSGATISLSTNRTMTW